MSSSASTGWPDWLSYHGSTFGFQSEVDLRMIGNWPGVFVAAGFGPDEMLAASRSLAASGQSSSWRADHLNALLERARNGRSRPLSVTGQDQGACTLCDGIGMVTVPHPRTVNGDVKEWYTCMVTCSCALGRWQQQRIGECKVTAKSESGGLSFQKGNLLTLEEYEVTVNPRWREDMQAHAESLRRHAMAESEARALDKSRGPMPSLQTILKHARSKAQ